MSKLNRSKMDESTDSKELRAFMRRHRLNLWEMARLMELPSCVLASLVLGESFLDDELRLRLDKARLELLFNCWPSGRNEQ